MINALLAIAALLAALFGVSLFKSAKKARDEEHNGGKNRNIKG